MLDRELKEETPAALLAAETPSIPEQRPGQ
jgi:hypothetical protein